MKKLRGFSLIELMLSLALGTIIVLAVSMLLITNIKTNNLQTNTRLLQQEGLFALEHMTHNVRRLGYTKTSADSQVGVVFSGEEISKDGEQNDVFVISFEVDIDKTLDIDTNPTTAPRDCEGNIITETKVVTQKYWVDNRSLKCEASGSAAAMVLIDDVSAFQVLYGVDAKKDGQAVVSRYLTASKYKEHLQSNPENPFQIVAVRIGFILERESQDGTVLGSSTTMQLLDEEIELDDSKKDIKRLFIKTIPIRNFNTERI